MQLNYEAFLTNKLGEVTERLWRAPNLEAGLADVLATTADLLGAYMANIQFADSERPVLRIVAQSGFSDELISTFRKVPFDDGTACARAFRAGRRVLVEDIQLDELYAPHRELLAAAGCRAVCSTPLVGWGGKPVGVLSTYFHTPRRPSETELRWFEFYARLATAFIERYRADEALLKRESELRLAIEASQAGIWSWDIRKDQVTWDERTGEFFGPSPGNLESVVSKIHEEDRARVMERLAEMQRTPGDDHYDLEFRLIPADGRLQWIHGIGKAERDSAGALVRLNGLTLDATARRQTEAALVRSSQAFRDLVDNSPDGIARLDLEGRYVLVNRRFAEQIDCTPEDFVGKTIGMMTARDTRPWVERIKRVGATGKAEEFDHFSDRRGFISHIRFIPEKLPDGSVCSVLMISTDITERLRVETLARERASLIETLFDIATQGIFAVDANGNIQLMNRMAEEMFGYGPAELLNKPHDVLVPEEARAKHAGHRNAFFHSPTRRPMGQGMELLARNKDGSLFPVEVSLSHLDTERGRLAVSFVADISIRRRQEAELRKMEAAVLNAEEDAARQLARELHDDLTQRLAFVSMELGRLADAPTLPDIAEHLRSGQTRIQQIAESLRNISHRMHPAILDDLGLVAALEDLVSQFERASGIPVQYVARNVPNKIPRTVASGVYRACQECLRNITKHAEADEVSIVLSYTANTLELEIHDSGIGFDPAAVKKGLGMYSMQERIRIVNGAISVDSVPGEGTRVFIRVPLEVPA